jgi:hypothetical protein
MTPSRWPTPASPVKSQHPNPATQLQITQFASNNPAERCSRSKKHCACCGVATPDSARSLNSGAIGAPSFESKPNKSVSCHEFHAANSGSIAILGFCLVKAICALKQCVPAELRFGDRRCGCQRQRRCSHSHCSGCCRTQPSITAVTACMVPWMSTRPSPSRTGRTSSDSSPQKLLPSARRTTLVP